MTCHRCHLPVPADAPRLLVGGTWVRICRECLAGTGTAPRSMAPQRHADALTVSDAHDVASLVAGAVLGLLAASLTDFALAALLA